MRLVRDLVGPPLATEGTVVAVGAFDGLHLGHQRLLAALRANARRLGVPAVVISFEPLPRAYFQPTETLRLLPPAERLRRLRALGLDAVWLLRFDARLAAMSAEDFVAQVLVARAQAREVWVGADFRFGHRRLGDLDLLRRMGAASGFDVRALADVTVDGERVSSSAVRAALAAAEFDHAARLLGRRYRFRRRVVRGRQLGRTLGFPTANLRWPSLTAAMRGIYAVRVDGASLCQHPGVVSLGVRPTVGGTEPLLEVHLFDFEGDLYGRVLDVEFVAKLRDELKFDSLSALVEQMQRDAAEARSVLAATVAPVSSDLVRSTV